jgi:hypothetical protein
VLQPHVADLGHEITATRSRRDRHAWRDTGRQLEQILGAVTGTIDADAAVPDEWEVRNRIPGVDRVASDRRRKSALSLPPGAAFHTLQRTRCPTH